MLRHQDTVTVSAAAMAQGIRETRWPARLQRLGEGPLTELLPDKEFLLDGGHNPDAAVAIARYLERHALKPVDAVIGMMAAKDARRFLAILGATAGQRNCGCDTRDMIASIHRCWRKLRAKSSRRARRRPMCRRPLRCTRSPQGSGHRADLRLALSGGQGARAEPRISRLGRLRFTPRVAPPHPASPPLSPCRRG